MTYSLRSLTATLAALLFVSSLPAQAPDRVILTNGDNLTGTIKTMGEGKVTLTHAAIGDIEIKFEDIANLTTGGVVTLVTKGGERLQRQVTGIENGELKLAPPEGGPSIGSVARQDLASINPPADPKPKWTGSINLGASISTGNTDRRNVVASAEAVRRTEFDRITAKGAWNYADEKTSPGNRNRTERRLEGSMQYDYFLSEKAYVFGLAGAAADEQADLDLRFTGGGGVGYQWVEDPEFAFATEAGVTYFSETFGTAPDTSTVAGRLAYHLKWQVAPWVEFLQDVEYYPSLEKGSDLFVTKDSRARITLTESMFAQLQWILDYDTTPAAGLNRADNRYLLTLGWNF